MESVRCPHCLHTGSAYVDRYFNTPKGQLLGLYAASVYLPSFIFAFVGEQISNRWGRRVAIWTGTVILLIGGIWNAFATDAGQFIGSRVIIGSGGAIAKVSAPALLVEIAHPRLRPVLGGIYYGLFYSGSFMSAVMCSKCNAILLRIHADVSVAGLYIPGTWSWRMPCFLQCIGPLLVLAFTCTAPESPRVSCSSRFLNYIANYQFLIKKGRNEQALNVFAKYHANGQVDDPLVQWEYHEVQSAIQQEESVTASYLDFFRTPGNRRRLFVIISISVGTNWVGNSLISFYLAPILRSVGVADPVKIASINAGLAIWNLTIAVSAGTQVERFGRRPLFLTSFIGMFCSYAVVMGLSATFATQKNQAAGLAAVPFLFIFYG
jgi:MFS family permease